MEKALRLNAEQREDLVAYLDGELPDEKSSSIDQIIARSEVARHEVEALARTFELLDVLPSMKASADFTSKTIGSLRALEQPMVLSDQWWYIYLVRIGIVLLWTLSLAASGFLGFQLTRHWVPNPNERVLTDLPVIENLHLYREIGEFEFLKQLKTSGLFDETQEE